jgi:ribosome maturation factor RimP
LPPKNVRDFVYALVEPIIQENGLELIEVEFVKEGANWYLRLYIDKEQGIDLEDCQQISRLISDLLDKEDPIDQAYFLEVSSPGLERPLKREKDFQKYKGCAVIVNTYTPIEGKKELRGKLGVYNNNTLNLIIEPSGEIQIPRKAISQVKLDWEDQGRRNN